MADNSATSTTTSRVDKMDAAIRNGREALRLQASAARRRRRLALLLHLIFIGGIMGLTGLLMAVKLLRAAAAHPGITSATAVGTAVAVAGVMLLPVVGHHHEHPGAMPTASTPPLPTVPPTTAPHSPPPHISPGRPPTPSSMEKVTPTLPSAEASASVSPAPPLPISPPTVGMSPRRQRCTLGLDVDHVRLQVRCRYRSPIMLRPLLDAKRDVSLVGLRPRWGPASRC